MPSDEAFDLTCFQLDNRSGKKLPYLDKFSDDHEQEQPLFHRARIRV